MGVRDVKINIDDALKSDLRGIEIASTTNAIAINNLLKSDLRGIEINAALTHLLLTSLLKSDLRGIEILSYPSAIHEDICVKIRP